MAVLPAEQDQRRWDDLDRVYITLQAQDQLEPSDIWYHLGGFSDEGDTYETQEHEFGEALEMFWSKVTGPGEHLRAKIVQNLEAVKGDWDKITIDTERTVVIAYKDGSTKMLKSPFVQDATS